MVSDVKKASKMLDGLEADAQLLWLVLNSSMAQACSQIMKASIAMHELSFALAMLVLRLDG